MSAPGDEDRACPVPELTPDVYARWRATELGRLTEDLERGLILELAGDVTGKNVLEIGCGDGDLAVELAKRRAQVSAIDGSAAMIEAARRRISAERVEVDLAVADAEALPFPEERFDLVVAVTILCFVRDARPVFREIARVLRPGGRLVIGELGAWSSWAAERRVRAWLGSAMWQKGVFRTPSELRGLATGAGLTVERLESGVYYPRWTPAARLMAPLDRRISRVTHIGAAFLAISVRKPA
ncbi:MAG: methyltransferase domain-containing protein [Hyphomicrobiaceae bacterium]|nr:methyltransferase domain-containing protein [Hyphomicrobiaceae bacterium]